MRTCRHCKHGAPAPGVPVAVVASMEIGIGWSDELAPIVHDHRLSFRIGGTAGLGGRWERCSTMRNPLPRRDSFMSAWGFLSALNRSPALPPPRFRRIGMTEG